MGNICVKKYNHVNQDDDTSKPIKKKKRRLKDVNIRSVIIHFPSSARFVVSRSLHFI
jgi:hypothetical protein